MLGELEPDDYVVLSPASNRFVQVAVQDFALRVESVGDQFLHPTATLTVEQVARLETLGLRGSCAGPAAPTRA